MTKLPGFLSILPPRGSRSTPVTLVERFLERFLGERLLGSAPRPLGGGEEGRSLLEAGEEDSVDGRVSKPARCMNDEHQDIGVVNANLNHRPDFCVLPVTATCPQG